MPTGEQIQPNHLDLSSTTNFSLRFPVLNDTISKIEQLTDFEEVKLKLKFADDLSLSAGTRTFFKNNVKRVLEAVDAELTAVLGAFWTNLRAQSQDLLSTHTILVLWRATQQPLFDQLSLEEQNVLKWTCLLHDLAKRGTPLILGRDHCHAFRSAAAALEVFKHLGILLPTGPSSKSNQGANQPLESVLRLISESFQPLPEIWRDDFRHGKPVVTVMHAHHNLPEIFHNLWELKLAPRDSFVDQIFRLVLFHDSIEALETRPNMINLSEKEKAKYCDQTFYKLMQILHIADNDAYVLFDESHQMRCTREIMSLYGTLVKDGP